MSSKKTAPPAKRGKAASAKKSSKPAAKAAPKSKAPASKASASKAPASKASASKARASKLSPKRGAKRAEPPASPVDVVGGVLHAIGWTPERSDDEDGWVSFVTHVDDGVVTVATVARVLEDSSRFVLYAILSPRAGEDVRPEVAEFLLRANYGMPDGNFEMDPLTGEVRFKVGVDFCGMPLQALLVRNAVLDAGAAIESYGPALARVLHGEATASEAIAEAEGA